MRTLSTPTQALGPLYRGTFLFGIACGISIALTPLYLDAHGFEKQEIGTLALIFAAGLVTFALPVGGLIRRFGGKQMLVATLLGYCVCVGGFPFMGSFAAIAAIRFLDGVFSIGVWVSSETLVLSQADKKHKGHLTSLYAIWLASGYVAGPLLATGLTRFLSHREMFMIAAAFGAVAALYLGKVLKRGSAVSDSNAESGEHELEDAVQAVHGGVAPISSEAGAVSDLSVAAILGRIKTSCFAAFSYGYFQASVVLFLPLYLIESKGIPRDDTIILPGLFCLGMLLCSNGAGRLGDRYGHLRLVSSLSALGTLCVLGFVFVDNYWLMCVLVFGAGATFASMSPVALALTGVVIPSAQLSRANSFYNTFYASGMLVGPLLTSLIFTQYGGPMMLYHLAALWSAFVIFTLIYASDDPASRGIRVLARTTNSSVS